MIYAPFGPERAGLPEHMILIRRLEIAFRLINTVAVNMPVVERSLPMEQLGIWSIKDLLAHFSGWNDLTISNIYSSLYGGKIRWIEENQINEFNRLEVAKRQHLFWQEVYSEFVDSTQRLLKLYSELTPEELNTFMNKDLGFTILTSIATDLMHFCDDHLLDLMKVWQDPIPTKIEA